MHNDLAWAVLGVEPSTGAVIEASARLQRIPTGQFLEQLMASSESAAAESAEAAKREERLSDLISDMANSLMAAADVVKAGRSKRAVPASVIVEPEQRHDEVTERASLAERPAPAVIAIEEEAGPRPTPEQLQAWMRAADKNDAPKRARTFGRALLRRSA